MNTAKNFINKVLEYSHPNFYNKNMNIIRDTLYLNSFPPTAINHLILTTQNNNNANPENDAPTQQQPQPLIYRSAFYVSSLSSRIKAAPIRDKERTRIAFKSTKTLKSLLFTNTKGKIDTQDKSDVVYLIKCNGNAYGKCSSLYIGTSKQKLRNRLSGHRSDINNGGSQKTALALHCIEHNHKPDPEDVKILEIERNPNKRMLLEMLHINRTDNTVNRQSDCENLSTIYSQLIKKIM